MQTVSCIALCCCGPILMATAASARAADVTLTRDGKPAAVIVVAAIPTPAANLAALELQYHIAKMTGATLPIASDAEGTKGVRILVGESAATRKLGLRGDDFASQEYLIRFLPETVVLIGRDWRNHVRLREAFRPEYRRLVSNPGRIRGLGWAPEVDFDELAALMVRPESGV